MMETIRRCRGLATRYRPDRRAKMRCAWREPATIISPDSSAGDCGFPCARGHVSPRRDGGKVTETGFAFLKRTRREILKTQKAAPSAGHCLLDWNRTPARIVRDGRASIAHPICSILGWVEQSVTEGLRIQPKGREGCSLRAFDFSIE